MGLFNSDQAKAKKKADDYRNLIRQEAIIGGKLFGPIKPGHRREFFCLDERTWVWHEEWTDAAKVKHIQTTRYDVRPDGIVKCQNNGPYMKTSLTEANHLLQAAELYQKRVSEELYRNKT